MFRNGHRMKLNNLDPLLVSSIIRMGWEDRTTFDEIFRKTGIPENQVIRIMRRELKPSSFRMWRKRVSGRKTKHQKILARHLEAPDD